MEEIFDRNIRKMFGIFLKRKILFMVVFLAGLGAITWKIKQQPWVYQFTTAYELSQIFAGEPTLDVAEAALLLEQQMVPLAFSELSDSEKNDYQQASIYRRIEVQRGRYTLFIRSNTSEDQKEMVGKIHARLLERFIKYDQERFENYRKHLQLGSNRVKGVELATLIQGKELGHAIQSLNPLARPSKLYFLVAIVISIATAMTCCLVVEATLHKN